MFVNTAALQVIYVCVRVSLHSYCCWWLLHNPSCRIANFPFAQLSMTIYGCWCCWSSHTHTESQLIKVFLCCWHGRSLSIKRVKFLSISCAHAIKPKPTEFLPKTVGHWFRIYNITLHNITYKLYLCLSSKAWLIGMPTLLTLGVTCMANWGCSLSVVCQRLRLTFLTMLFISRWDQQQKESKVVRMLTYIV